MASCVDHRGERVCDFVETIVGGNHRRRTRLEREYRRTNPLNVGNAGPPRVVALPRDDFVNKRRIEPAITALLEHVEGGGEAFFGPKCFERLRHEQDARQDWNGIATQSQWWPSPHQCSSTCMIASDVASGKPRPRAICAPRSHRAAMISPVGSFATLNLRCA